MTLTFPPTAKRLPRQFQIHGESIADDYFWLRDRDNPEVLAYLQAENQYTQEIMQPTRAHQELLYAEMRNRIKETDQSVPFRKGQYLYSSRTVEGLQYPIYCRSGVQQDAGEEIILDVNELASGWPYFDLGVMEISDDGRLLAYSADTRGFREYTLFIKDLSCGELLADSRTHVDSVVWAADNASLLFTVEDSAKRPWKALVLKLGGSDDVVLYEEPDQRFRLYVSRTLSGAYCLLSSRSHTTSEVRYASATAPVGSWQVVAPRKTNHKYDVTHRGEYFYIRSNQRGVNFAAYRVPSQSVGQAEWEEVLPPRENVMLEEIVLFAEHAVFIERQNGLPQYRIRKLRNGQEHCVTFPEPVFHARPADNCEFDASRFRFAYSSPVTPNSVYDYDLDNRTMHLLKRDEVGGDFDTGKYSCKRVYARAADGVQIPITIAYRAHEKSTGPSPLLLMGYGAYGFSLSPAFSSARISLLDRGVTIAMAHVRGGGEMGKAWHDGGRMLNKKNTISDFRAVAAHLISAGMTTPEKMVITGGSAGGLLIGAVLNEQPEMCRAAVLVVPFVDLINSMLDESLPLTVGEFEEWGNPKRETEFRYMRSYCPYSNLQPQKYPHLLVRASLHDSQVMYWEPAKYVARMRALCGGAPNVLLHTNLSAGHSGASGRYDRLRETAFDYAYILEQLGLPTSCT